MDKTVPGILCLEEFEDGELLVFTQRDMYDSVKSQIVLTRHDALILAYKILEILEDHE